MANGNQSSGSSSKIKTFGAVAGTMATLLIGTLTFGTELTKLAQKLVEPSENNPKQEEPKPAPNEKDVTETTQPTPSKENTKADRPAAAVETMQQSTPIENIAAAQPTIDTQVGEKQKGTLPTQQSSLGDIVPEKVGNYTLQRVNPVYNLLNATEALEFVYQTPNGDQVFLTLWAYPSSYAADQEGGILANQGLAQGHSFVGTFPVQGTRGNKLGTGLALQNLQDDWIIWTNNSILAGIVAPPGYGLVFYDALPILVFYDALPI
jgi:hypothetical protein